MDSLKLKELLEANGFVETTYPTDTRGEIFLAKTFKVADLPLFVKQFAYDEPDEKLPEDVVLEYSLSGGIMQYCVDDMEIDYWKTINPIKDTEALLDMLKLFGLLEK